MLALAGLLLLTLTAAAQTVAGQAGQDGKTSSPTAHPTRHVAHHHKRHVAAKVQEPVVVAPVPPPVPPAQQAASPAKIDFRQGTLRINAENSSLVQILNAVSQKTGMAVEGLGHDERMYGQYGPGPVASTLTKLLDGAGYDYVITGGSASGPPTKLILTTGNSMPGSATAATAYSAPVATAEPANPSEAPHTKTPQEIFDEIRAQHHPGRPLPQ
jgi:hypothetical protein